MKDKSQGSRKFLQNTYLIRDLFEIYKELFNTQQDKNQTPQLKNE